MQSDELLQTDPEAIEELSGEPPKRHTTWFLALHVVAFVAGLSVVAWFIYYKWDTIGPALARVGWGFLLLIAFNIIRHFLRAASMYRAIAPEKRTFKYRRAVAARFGGEAVTLFSAFTGPYLGDATKVMLMKKDLPITDGASAVITDNILYYTSVIFIVLAGVVTLLVRYGSSGSTMSKVLLAIVIAMIVAFSVFAAAILFQVTPFTHFIDFLAKRNIAPKFLLNKRESILKVENNVFQFYHTRPADFFIVFSISLCVHFMSILEVFCAMTFLGYEPTIAKAVIIEGLTKVVNLTYGFIPANMGVYEGGNELILKTIGYGSVPGVGVALALVRRGASLCGNLVGIVVLFWRGASGGAQRLAKTRDKAI
jgi:Lysylphosphatidylglycerol synthase TM region